MQAINEQHWKAPCKMTPPRWVVSIGKRIDGEVIIAHRLKFFRGEFAAKMRDALAKSWEVALLNEEHPNHAKETA